MELTEMRKKDQAQLQRHAEKTRTRLEQISRERYVKELKNIREIRQLKKELARTLTVIKEKEEK